MQAENALKPKGLNSAEITHAAGLVNYQEGSIVKKQTGTVTIFAFDEGESLSEHTAPFDALAHVLEGEAGVSIAGKPNRLHGGDIILIPAQQPHSLKALKQFKMTLTTIRS